MRLARQSHKDSYVFKRKSNECQFKANKEVKERLEVAASYLDRVEAASGKEQLDLARKEIAKGTSFLARRQKLIKLADRSELGCAVVEEYDADMLAHDSDDEKKIEKAEKAAERKLAKRRKVQNMSISMQSSKTDQYREGVSFGIARTGLVTCPMSMMERHFRMGKLDHSSPGLVFRGIVKTKEGEGLCKTGGLSYSRLRELLL